MPLISSQCLSVTQITAYIKNIFSGDNLLVNVRIQGEVSNIKYHTSGHIYFTLKDAGAELHCVMFKSNASKATIRPQNGDQIVVTGRINVYEAGGNYQLYAATFEAAGLGALYERYEKLKEKLSNEGLFEKSHKKPIPQYAKTVGIVTASTGAAIQDICNISARRNPYVQLILCPATVQGPGAADTIVRAIKCLDMLGVDVIIVGRGGGSIEDLWAFNEESVARAIYDCNTPIISAVGHETDTTIADWVSDLRAPTPSAGAELAVFKLDDAYLRINKILGEMNSAVTADLAENRQLFEHYSQLLSRLDPRQTTQNRNQQLDALTDKLVLLMNNRIAKERSSLYTAKLKLSGNLDKKAHFYRAIYNRYPGRLQALMDNSLINSVIKLENIYSNIDKSMTNVQRRDRDRLIKVSPLIKKSVINADIRSMNKLKASALALDSLSPLKRMASGYGYISGEDYKAKRSVNEFVKGDNIIIRLQDGRVRAQVNEIEYFNGDNK